MASKWERNSIRNLRLRLGMTQADFARKLGCRQQTISEWEHGLYEPNNAYGRLLSMINELAPQELPVQKVVGRDHFSKAEKTEPSESITHLTKSALNHFDNYFSGHSFDPDID